MKWLKLSLVFLMIFCMLIATTESHAAKYHEVLRPNFTWHQVVNKKHTYTMVIDKPRVTVMFEAIAKSPKHGNFTIRLEKQGFFGLWHTIGYAYTFEQHSLWKWSPRLNTQVIGQPFKGYWWIEERGNYRVTLERPTNPQSTLFSQVYFYYKD